MMKEKLRGNTAYILLSVALLSVLMNYIDAILQPGYVVKSACKLLLFSAAMLIYFLKNREELAYFRSCFRISRRALLYSVGAGLLILAVIVGGYLLLRGYLDFSAITTSLSEGGGITAENFVFVAVYISFCNSFLEELFFRGFAFLVLKRTLGGLSAYFFSSFCFAFYHVGMTLGWVALPLFLLELAGLMLAGLFFNRIDEKNESVLPSYLLHMFCNFGINTVGFILFGIL